MNEPSVREIALGHQVRRTIMVEIVGEVTMAMVLETMEENTEEAEALHAVTVPEEMTIDIVLRLLAITTVNARPEVLVQEVARKITHHHVPVTVKTLMEEVRLLVGHLEVMQKILTTAMEVMAEGGHRTKDRHMTGLHLEGHQEAEGRQVVDLRMMAVELVMTGPDTGNISYFLTTSPLSSCFFLGELGRYGSPFCLHSYSDLLEHPNPFNDYS
jgi:hypothetical protein